LLEYRENKHLELKALGDANRKQHTDPLSQHLTEYSNKLSDLRAELREKQHELKKEKGINNF
jgi:hypothetical protein